MHICPLGSSVYPLPHPHIAFGLRRDIEHNCERIFQLEPENFVPFLGGVPVITFPVHIIWKKWNRKRCLIPFQYYSHEASGRICELMSCEMPEIKSRIMNVIRTPMWKHIFLKVNVSNAQWYVRLVQSWKFSNQAYRIAFIHCHRNEVYSSLYRVCNGS